MDVETITPASTPQGGTGGAGTPQASQEPKQTAGSGSQPAGGQPGQQVQMPSQGGQPGQAQPQPRMVPLDELVKTRKQLREMQRQLAEGKLKSSMAGYDPNDLEQVTSHPFVQDLMIKDAKREVTDYARELLDSYPKFPPIIRKAILKNVRGFINENTTDPETAKIDVAHYIEDIATELEAEAAGQKPQGATETQVQTQFPVSPSNAGSVPQAAGTKPAEIQAILDKAVDDWTDEDVAKIDAYNKAHPKQS